MTEYVPELKSNRINARRLMKHWDIEEDDLMLMIEDGLPAYEQDKGLVVSNSGVGVGWRLKKNTPKRLGLFGENHLERCIKNQPSSIIFKKSDIEKFESKHPELSQETLDANDRRELGRLRNEKIKWDDSIAAAVHIGIFCSKLKHRITRAELSDEIFSKGYKDLPDTTIKKIWKAMPETLRKQSGRPPKK